MKMIEMLFILIVAHFLGDFPLQGTYLAENKGNNDYLLFAHSFIWAGTLSAGLIYFGTFAMWKAAFLLAVHFIVDRWKARKSSSGNLDLYIDQFFHGIQILVVALF
jgi:hypothetical protein